MKQALTALAINLVLGAAVVFLILGTAATLELKAENDQRAQEKRDKAGQAVKWRDLDKAGQYMTSYDRIGIK